MCRPPPIIKVDGGVKTSARLHKLLGLLSHYSCRVFNFRRNKTVSWLPFWLLLDPPIPIFLRRSRQASTCSTHCLNSLFWGKKDFNYVKLEINAHYIMFQFLQYQLACYFKAIPLWLSMCFLVWSETNLPFSVTLFSCCLNCRCSCHNEAIFLTNQVSWFHGTEARKLNKRNNHN